MKSAYELAMERLQAEEPDAPKLTDAQKNELAEIDQRYQSKLAERELFLQQKIVEAQSVGNLTDLEQLQTQLRNERARLEEEKEAAKDKVRQAKG